MEEFCLDIFLFNLFVELTDVLNYKISAMYIIDNREKNQ